MTSIDAALVATSKKLYALQAENHTGKIMVEYNMLNGGITKASAEHKDHFYTPEKRNS